MPAPNVLTIDVDHWGTAAADPAAALPAAGITVRIYRKRSDGASPAIADGSAFSTDTETALTRLESLTSTTNADGIATFQLRASAAGTFYRMRIGTDPAVDFLMPDADLALTPDSIIHPAETAPALAATRFTALSDTPDELTPGQYFRVDENRNIEQVDEPSGGEEGISAVEVEAPITGDGTSGDPIGLTLRDEDIPDGIARDSEIPSIPTELPPTDGSVTARKLASDLVLPDSAIPAGIARDSELPTVPSTSSPWPTAPTLSESDIPAAIARDTEVTAAVSTETTARESAETALGTRIDGVATAITSEKTARTEADTALGVRIDNIDTSTDDALKHQVDHLTGLTGDLTAGTASSGWSDASADAQGGYSLSQSEFSTQAEARAATVWQREGNPASSDFFVARIPADTAPENARLLLTSGEGVAFPQLLSQLQTLGTSADSAWKYYTNSFELGADVNSLKLQLTGTAAHYGTTTYAGNLDRGKVYEQVKDILVGGTDDDTAETVTLPAGGGGGSTGPATLDQIGIYRGLSSGYVANTRIRTGINIPTEFGVATALHMDVNFPDNDHRSVWFHPREFRAATGVDRNDLTGGTEFRQTTGGENAYVAHFYRRSREIVMSYEGTDGEAPAVTVETIRSPQGEPGTDGDPGPPGPTQPPSLRIVADAAARLLLAPTGDTSGDSVLEGQLVVQADTAALWRLTGRNNLDAAIWQEVSPQAASGPPAPALIPFALIPTNARSQISTSERSTLIAIRRLPATEFASRDPDVTSNSIDMIAGSYTAVLSFQPRAGNSGSATYSSNDRWAVRLAAEGTGVISRLVTNEYLRTISDSGDRDRYGGETRAIEFYVPARTAVSFRWRYSGSEASGPYLDPSEIMIFPRGT